MQVECFLNLVLYFAVIKSYPNKQSDADHGNRDGCQLVTQKRDNSSNSFDFRLVYSLYRFTKKLWNILVKNVD